MEDLSNENGRNDDQKVNKSKKYFEFDAKRKYLFFVFCNMRCCESSV